MESGTRFTLTDVKHLLKMAQRGLIHSPLQFTKSLQFISLKGLSVANRMLKEESLRRMKNKNKKGAGMAAAVIKYKFNILQNRIAARNIYCTE